MKIRSAFYVLCGLFVSIVEAHAQGTWNVPSGNWSAPGSWVSGFLPTNGPTGTATFNGAGPQTSTLDLDYQLQNIFFQNTGSLVLNNSAGHTITINGAAVIAYGNSGSVALDVPIIGTTGATGGIWLNGGTGTLTLNPGGPGLNTYWGSTQVGFGATLVDGGTDSYSANSSFFVGGATPSSVDVNFDETIASLGDGSGGPGLVVIASGKTLSITGGFSSTFSGIISGAGGLSLTNPGTFTLINSNTYTGPTAINTAGSSTLQIGNGVTSGSFASSGVSGVGDLAFDEPVGSPTTYSGIISGGIHFDDQGPGVVILSGANTYSGPTTIFNGATLQANSLSAFGGATGNSAVQLNGNAILNLSGFSNTIGSLNSISATSSVTLGAGTLTVGTVSSNTGYSGSITGTGGLNSVGFALALTGNSNTYSGGTTITGGTIVADNSSGASSAIGSGSITILPTGTLLIGQADTNGYIGSSSITDNGTLGFFRTDTITIANTISGTGGVMQNGIAGGTTILSGTNTYSGATTVFQGTLKAGSTSAFGGPTGKSQISFTSSGTLDITGFNNTVGSFTGGATMGGITLGANTLTTNDTSGNGSFAAVISGLGGSMVFGNNSTILTGANTYTGGTSITFGTVLVANTTGSGLGTGPISISSGAALDVGAGSTFGTFGAGAITDNGTINFNRSDQPTIANIISGTGGITMNGGGVILTGANTYVGITTIGAGAMLQIGNGGSTGSLANSTVVQGSGTLLFDRSDASFFIPVISGAVNVVQQGTGSTFVSELNNYTGTTTINFGTLQAGASSSFGTGVVTINGSGVLDASFPFILGVGGLVSASPSSSVLLGTTGILEVENLSNETYAGTMSGAGGQMWVNGNSTFTLSGTSSYTGITKVLGGTFADGAAHAFAPLSPVILGNAAIDVNFNETVNGLNDFGGPAGTVVIAPGATLTLSNSSSTQASISGGGGLTFSGAGTYSLQGTNTYSGLTSVNVGMLTDGSPGAFSPNSRMLVNLAGGSLMVNFNEAVADLENGGTGGPVDIVSTSASLASLGQAYSADFMGNISGMGKFIVAGGVQGLGGNNTYSGGTIITGGGELFVSSNTALGTGSAAFSAGTQFSPDANVTLANDILLVGGEALDNDDGGPNNMTLTGNISETGGVGSITWCTPATLTLTGNNSFTGGVDMREGTLVAGSNTAAGIGGTITLDTSTTLNVLSGVTTSNPLNFNGGAATLTGSGTIASPVDAGASVIISPMASPGGGPGTLTFSSGLTFAPGAAVHFDLYDTTGAAGTGYGLISATGGLDFTATANSITFNVVTTDAVGNAANALHFNPATPYSWMFTTSTAAITGFNPNEFNIVQSGFLNSTGGGTFDVSMAGNNLYLNFTPVPEPSTWCLIGAGLAAIVPFALRRRRLARA